jgi:hypothetical protein
MATAGYLDMNNLPPPSTMIHWARDSDSETGSSDSESSSEYAARVQEEWDENVKQ